MSLYRKVDPHLWLDSSFRALSPTKPSAQSLYLYLFTGPHTGRIPGLFSVGRMALIEGLGWSTRAFNLAFAELEAAGLAQADWENRLVFLPRVLPMNTPMSPETVKKWREEWKLLSSCALKTAAFDAFSQFFRAYNFSHLAVFKEITGQFPSIEEEGKEKEKEKGEEKGTGSPAASLDSFFQITEERWQQATRNGFVDKAWVEQETRKFNLKGKGFAAKYPNIENAWLMWLQRGKEYAEKHPNVVPMRPVEAPRRRHLFGER